MPLHLRQLNENDYDSILVEWWKAWNWDAPAKEFLPSNGTGGLIVYDDDTPIVAGFMYTTNSSVAWVDWIISNPSYRKKPHRKEAIQWLISALTSICEKAGHSYVYALIKNKPLIEVYASLGFIKADTYTTEMIKKF